VGQRTPEWYAERQKGVGSSDAPVIAGVAPWGDIRSLYAEKVGLAPRPEENEPMRWGRLLENAIADGYKEMTGNRLRRINKIRRHREHPWMLASIDRAIVGRRRLVEIKTARFRNAEWGQPGSDEVPDHYRVQVQHQMTVTGYREADIAVLFSGSDLQLYTVGHDQRLADGLVQMEEAFWRRVESRTPPPDITPPALLLRTDAVPADERVTAMVAQLREDRARYSEAKAVKEGTEEALRNALDEVTFVKGQGFSVIYRPIKPRVKVGWEQVAASYRHLLNGRTDLDTIQELYTRTEPGNRPLLVKWEDDRA
jgi:putative phage-type endonuclease